MALTNVFCAHGTLESVVAGFFFADAGLALLGAAGVGFESGESCCRAGVAVAVVAFIGLAVVTTGLAALTLAFDAPRTVAVLAETLALEAAE